MKVTCEPPMMTGMPRSRHCSANRYPSVTVEVVVEMPTRSAAYTSFQSIGAMLEL